MARVMPCRLYALITGWAPMVSWRVFATIAFSRCCSREASAARFPNREGMIKSSGNAAITANVSVPATQNMVIRLAVKVTTSVTSRGSILVSAISMSPRSLVKRYWISPGRVRA